MVRRTSRLIVSSSKRHQRVLCRCVWQSRHDAIPKRNQMLNIAFFLLCFDDIYWPFLLNFTSNAHLAQTWYLNWWLIVINDHPSTYDWLGKRIEVEAEVPLWLLVEILEQTLMKNDICYRLTTSDWNTTTSIRRLRRSWGSVHGRRHIGHVL